MSIEAQVWALNLPLSGGAKLVLYGIATHADNVGDNAWPSVTTLARYAGIEPRSVQRALRYLEALGLLTTDVNGGGTRRTEDYKRPNLYRLNLDISAEVLRETIAAKAVHKVCKKRIPPDAHVTRTPDAHVTRTPDAHVTPPLTPTSPHPLTPTSPELSLELSLNTQGAGTREAECVCVDKKIPEDVCQAMAQAGVTDATAGHPKLQALLASGADLSEFTDAATEAVNKGKGFAYALGVVANRRKEAAAMALPPRPADVARATVPGKPGRDPALVRIEAEAAKAVPPPPEIRARMAAMCRAHA